MIPKGKWKHGAKLRGKPTVDLGQNSQPQQTGNAAQGLREVALKACSVVGKGLYGVDIKEVNGDYVVVEVNDNPSIYAGYEDSSDHDIYQRIIKLPYQNRPKSCSTHIYFDAPYIHCMERLFVCPKKPTNHMKNQ